jgi:hypothetical protein
VLRPLWVDLALTLIPLALALAAWVVGRFIGRTQPRYTPFFLAVVCAMVPLPLLRLIPTWRDTTDLVLHRLGGTTRLELGLAVLLLGYVSGRRGDRSARHSSVSCPR